MKASTISKLSLAVIILLSSVSISTSSKIAATLPPKIKREGVQSVEPITPKPIKLQVPELIEAMIIVESDGRDHVIGDKHLGKNHAAGALQIRPVMVREVNRILKLQHKKKRYTLKDRFSRQKSIEMFNIWRQFHHPDDDFEKIARNWNGGPKGYLKNKTVEYWVEVQMELNK